MTYAVTWNENNGPEYVGKLDLGSGCVQLSGATQGCGTVRRLAADEVASVRLERQAGKLWAGSVLVIAGRDGTVLRLTPLQGLGVVHEIADELQSVRGKAVA